MEDFSKEADVLVSSIPFLGEESSTDGSEIGSRISASTRSKAPTRRSFRSESSLTARQERPRRRTDGDQSTRLSRVTFDESSITQSQASSSSDEEDEVDESAAPSGFELEDMYMEPSTLGSHHTRVRTPSLLRRLYIPGQTEPIPAPRRLSTHSDRSRSTAGDGDRTPRAQTFEFSPLPPSATVPPPLLFSAPRHSYAHSASRPISALVMPEIPSPPSVPEVGIEIEEPHSPSRLSRILNVPIADPHEGGSPRSRRSSRSPSPVRSRPPSPSGPRQPSPRLSARGSPRPSVQEFLGDDLRSTYTEGR